MKINPCHVVRTSLYININPCHVRGHLFMNTKPFCMVRDPFIGMNLCRVVRTPLCEYKPLLGHPFININPCRVVRTPLCEHKPLFVVGTPPY